MKVRQFEGKNGGVKNQFLIKDEQNGLLIFQSYDSIIATKSMETGKIILDKEFWDYSTTTSKYRNQFLNEDKQATLKKIKSGEYTLSNLN